MFADIIITKKAYDLNRLFCYKIPQILENDACPGKRVLVPFGKNKSEEGIIISVYPEQPDINNIKEITKILDAIPVITTTGFKLAQFIKEKYITTYYEALKLNMPSGLKSYITERVYLLNPDAECNDKKNNEIIDILFSHNGCKIEDLKEKTGFKDLRKRLFDLAEDGIVELRCEISDSIGEKKELFVKLDCDIKDIEKFIAENKRKKNAVKALKYLENHKEVRKSQLTKETFINKAGYDALLASDLIRIEEKRVLREPFKNKIVEEDFIPKLNKEQENAVNTILNKDKRTYLIHGVTGSGKTEVYLNVISKILEQGKNAIILVPEISLTPQMTKKFRMRFKDDVAVIHSGLSKEERYDQIHLINNKKIRVVVGARSAIFAPIENVGIIIIDEEHENSYKSDTVPKYDTVEVAKKRAEIEGAKLILASATPSVVSFYNAQTGAYELVELKERINKNMPEVHIVDMRKELLNGNFTPISERLKEEILKNKKRKEQTILFLNRRGYSTFVSCRECGFVAKCPNCDVSLTYHNNNKLVCHYCGYERDMYKQCPQCESKYIKYFGKGTEKVEEELKKAIPDISVIRMDSDTTGTKFAHEKILERFEKDNIDILLGTQMITKGLDFKNVTLAAVLAADGGLYLDDFRNFERTFSQITQVIGRAGRGEKTGRGIIQTYSPDHYVIKMAKEGNYKKFYESEIILRKRMKFPPFCDIINIVCQSEDKKLADKLIEDVYITVRRFKEKLGFSDEDIKLYPPGAAPLARIKNRYRTRFLIKSQSSDNLKGIFESIYSMYNKNYKLNEVSLSVDINPINML